MSIEAKLEETAARISGAPTAPLDLMSLLTDLLSGFLESCLGNDPASLAKRIKKPSGITISSLKRRARKQALLNRVDDPNKTAEQAVTTLLTMGQELSEAELVEFITTGGKEVLPEWI